MKPLPASSGDLLADRRADYAEALFASQDYADAAELMLGAVELAPDWALGWFRLGEMQEAAGDLDAAALAWTMALKLDPADRPGSALKLALIGKAPPVATPPSAFVEALFDQYAPNFDTSLVEKLGYRVPLYLDEAIRAVGEPSSGRGQGTGSTPQPDPNAERAKPSDVIGEHRFRLALDLGCGTGLMGERLRPIVERLEGFDISAAMLRKAERKGVYDHLGKVDLQQFSYTGAAPDLVTAADVFMYVGALETIIATVAGLLAADGLFAFSVEKLDAADGFALQPSRRYAHSEPYVRAVLAASGFAVLSLEERVIRQDRREPVAGLIVMAGR
ncbi:MAG TPA: methyltransferase domain-containing protein [Mesorhizobium sp.]|jgi:predicted TPR repeat methyltransferase|uniref:methyltransferase domain-containing protein n=1 Tax=Mesorhizobium sp. TaxID=1871066 RepID=UPI002DDD65EC|nr:methyltransferase domain-containing protein [Mesorhizobium sp.]HEV2505332.1 methyltransferase domain-containing protein [Mesorhizobium sp.]